MAMEFAINMVLPFIGRMPCIGEMPSIAGIGFCELLDHSQYEPHCPLVLALYGACADCLGDLIIYHFGFVYLKLLNAVSMCSQLCNCID